MSAEDSDVNSRVKALIRESDILICLLRRTVIASKLFDKLTMEQYNSLPALARAGITELQDGLALYHATPQSQPTHPT